MEKPKAGADVRAEEMRANLLGKIDLFCAKERVSPTRFGLAVMRDPAFVANLREGLDLRISTYTKITDLLSKPSQLARMIAPKGEKNGVVAGAGRNRRKNAGRRG
jgi:hypothetical protein